MVETTVAMMGAKTIAQTIAQTIVTKTGPLTTTATIAIHSGATGQNAMIVPIDKTVAIEMSDQIAATAAPIQTARHANFAMIGVRKSEETRIGAPSTIMAVLVRTATATDFAVANAIKVVMLQAANEIMAEITACRVRAHSPWHQ